MCIRDSQSAAGQSVAEGDGSSLLYNALLVGFSDGRPLLKLPAANHPVRAIAQSAPLTESDLGSWVVVMLDCGEPSRPIIIGKLASVEQSPQGSLSRMEIAAEEELVFKCGKACIKMSSDGTVAIRGANVVTRASHTNRIRGGNVQIN